MGTNPAVTDNELKRQAILMRETGGNRDGWKTETLSAQHTVWQRIYTVGLIGKLEFVCRFM